MSRPAAKTAQFWSAKDQVVSCTLCPHRCRILPGDSGLCGVRENQTGTLVLPFYGKISSIGLDPIEKKPLYHYYPGNQILSVGFLGCNFHCPFCQNYSISQSTDRSTQELSPREVVAEALATGSFAIAYTYNEPSIHYEFVTATAELAHTSSLKNVLVTNGHLQKKAATELLGRMDAVNIDLKSYDPRFYRRELGGDLEAVKQFIRIAGELCHVEITTLLITERNDSEEELNSIAGFIASVNPAIPLHVSAYYPTYHYTAAGTTPEQVKRAVQIASTTLDYVYPGNVPGDANTHCAACGNLLVERHAYRVTTPGLQGTACSACGTNAPIVIG